MELLDLVNQTTFKHLPLGKAWLGSFPLWEAEIGAFLLLLLEALLGLQGFSMADEGWSLTGYQQIFNAPESVQYLFLYYNEMWIGGLWNILFGWMGIYGFRLLNVLFMVGSWWTIYLILHRYINDWSIFVGALLVIAFHDYGVMVFDHSSVTVFLSLLSVYFLLKALREDSLWSMFVVGAILSINVFSRIPNITLFALLLLLIPYYAYYRNLKLTLKLLCFAVLGAVAGAACEFLLMAVLGHLNLFIDNITSGMSAATSSDSTHNLGTMLGKYEEEYIQIIKDLFKLAILPIIFLLRPRKLKNKVVFGGLILLLAAETVIIFTMFDHIFFLYSFCTLCVWLACVMNRGNEEVMYVSLAALIIMYVLPFGSDFGITNMGENCIWLASPLSLGLITNEFNKFDKDRKISGYAFVAVFVLLYLILSFWHIMNNAYFDEGPRWEKTYKINNPLATTFTSNKYAESTDEVLTQLNKYVKQGDYLLCYQNRPMLHYLTQTRPYLFNPWPWTYDSDNMEWNFDRAEQSIKTLPVIVREKCETIDFTAPDPDWDNTSAQDTYAHKNRKIELIKQFIFRHDYKVVWENEQYQILIGR